jgi:hypothetical protein
MTAVFSTKDSARKPTDDDSAEEVFLWRISRAKLPNLKASDFIKESLREMLGETAGIVTVSYTGDGDNDLRGFVIRLNELFGQHGCDQILKSMIDKLS